MERIRRKSCSSACTDGGRREAPEGRPEISAKIKKKHQPSGEKGREIQLPFSIQGVRETFGKGIPDTDSSRKRERGTAFFTSMGKGEVMPKGLLCF